MPDDDETLKPDPILTRKFILHDTGVHSSTLSEWVKDGSFPLPIVLNPGSAREICGWLTSDYLRWKASRPRRSPKAVSPNSYSDEARAKGRRTRAERAMERAQPAVRTEPASPVPPRIKRPRGRT